MLAKVFVVVLCVAALGVAWTLGFLLDPDLGRSPIGYQVGLVIPYMAIILGPSGLIAHFVFKSKSEKVWAWWIFASLTAGVMLFGAVNAVKIAGGGAL